MCLKIVLENPDRSYYCGDIIRGKVLLHHFNEFSTDLLKYCVRLKFEGRAEIELPYHQAIEKAKTLKKSRVYFKNTYKLGIGNFKDEETVEKLIPDLELEGTSELCEDKNYVFPFEYSLAEGGLAPSLSSKYGNISYTIEAAYCGQNVKQSAESDHTTSSKRCSSSRSAVLTFVVNGTLDLNELSHVFPNMAEPVKIKSSINICSILHCKLSPVLATLKIQKSGFSLGERIHFSTSIRNFSSLLVENVQLSLIQVVTCSIEKESVTYTHIYHRNIKSLQRTAVLKNDSTEWKDYLTVPAVAPTSVGAANFINIHYFLKLSMKIFTLPIQTLKLSIPVLIGTVPLSFLQRVSHVNVIVDQEPSCSYGQANPFEIGAEELEYPKTECEHENVMEVFQIDEDKDNTQFSNISSANFPIRTISEHVFLRDEKE